MGDTEVKFNPVKDIDDHVPIPRVSEKPLDSLDCISETFKMTIKNPLFDFDSEFTLNLDNPIFDIQNEESDESEMDTIMEEVQIHSSQSTTQIPPPYEKVLTSAAGTWRKPYALIPEVPASSLAMSGFAYATWLTHGRHVNAMWTPRMRWQWRLAAGNEDATRGHKYEGMPRVLKDEKRQLS
ncbi:hypothetical protein Tco_0763706 [Tanacetum coccineum]